MTKQKHVRITLFIIALAIITAMVIPISANSPISVYMDNEKIEFDVEPMIVNGRTMVPMRAIFEKLGAEVEWNAETRTATAFKDTTFVSITIGSGFMSTFFETIKLDAPAMIVDGRTLIPLRAVSEAFSCDVQWDGTTRTVNIYSEDFIDFSKATDTQTVVEVANATELLNSIGNNKRIVLTSSFYNFSNVGIINNPSVEKQTNWDDTYLDGYIIKNVVNLTIEGNAELVTNDLYADVLVFEKCGDITLSGLKIGHNTPNPTYSCTGAVIRFNICKDISINNCSLYGCGAYGIYADNAKDLSVTNSKIYDCSYTGIWLTGGSNATIETSSFYDSVHESGFLRIDNSTITCNNCDIYNIVCQDYGMFIDTFDSFDEPSVITFNNCNFTNNVFTAITNNDTDNIVFNSCKFANNQGNMSHPSVVYNNSSTSEATTSKVYSTSDAQLLFLSYVQQGINCHTNAFGCLTNYLKTWDASYTTLFYDYIRIGQEAFTQAYSMSMQYVDMQSISSDLKSIVDIFDTVSSGSYTVIQLGDILETASPYFNSILEKSQMWVTE